MSQAQYLVSKKRMADKLGMKGRYTGSLSKKTRRPHGKGCMEYVFLTYDGQWIDGDWTGFGKLTNKESGETYEGGFFDNMRHGRGVLNYPDGKQYFGIFRFGRMGKGHMSYEDGSTFWGYCNSESKPHGRGKFSFVDGSVFDGEFENGVIHGHGRMTLKDGRWYLGEWRNGQKNGYGIEVSSDGSRHHEGIFCNGKAASSYGRRWSDPECLRFSFSRENDGPGMLVGPLPKQRSFVGKRFLNSCNKAVLTRLKSKSKYIDLLSSTTLSPDLKDNEKNSTEFSEAFDDSLII